MSRKLLIVVDMQKDFIDGSLGTAEARAIVPAVVQKILDFDGDVVYTMDTHGDDYFDTMEGKKLPVAHCVRGTEGWELEPSVSDALKKRGARQFPKTTFGSLQMARELAETFSDDGKTEFELVGLCTDICVVSNALILRAAFPNAVIRADAGCCAGVTPDSHQAALTTMQMCQIDVSDAVG